MSGCCGVMGAMGGVVVCGMESVVDIVVWAWAWAWTVAMILKWLISRNPSVPAYTEDDLQSSTNKGAIIGGVVSLPMTQ